jgi:DNA polymerase sigma
MSAGALLEFRCTPSKGPSVDIDLSVNKELEVLNSELLRTYAKLDPRF